MVVSTPSLFSLSLSLPRTGELTNRLASDTAVIQSAVTENVSILARYSLQLIISIGVMFWINARLTAVLLSVFPLISIAAVYYGMNNNNFEIIYVHVHVEHIYIEYIYTNTIVYMYIEYIYTNTIVYMYIEYIYTNTIVYIYIEYFIIVYMYFYIHFILVLCR